MSKLCSAIALSIFSLSALSGEWDYPAGNETVSDSAAAENYVESHYPELEGVSHRYTTDSHLGFQYNFDITDDGEYKHQRTIVVHTDKSGLVQRVYKSFADTILINGEPSTSAELEAPRRLKAEEPPELSSGTLVTATVNIVDPDLRTMDKMDAPDSPWTDVSDYPNAAQFNDAEVEVLSSGGKFYLSNSRVTQVDAEYLEEQDPDTGLWSQSGSASFLAQEGIAEFDQLSDLNNLTFASEDFTQVMAFYHLDQSIRYLESLGYNLFFEPVVFDARGLANDNSSYFYGPSAAMFGIGGSPDAIDADIVIHELAHGIHYQIVPDWGYGHTGAMGEGFADYWAGSYSYRKLYEEGSEFEIDTVFNWDGYFGTRISTRSLWNQRARYFEGSEYRAHVSVAGELGDELWSTPLFQTLKQAVELYGEPAFAEIDTLVLESMYGLGRGMKMHDLVESMLYTANALYPSRDYQALLKQNFAVHGLVKEPFKVELDSRFVDQDTEPQIRILANGRQAKIDGAVTAMSGSRSSVTSEKFDAISRSVSIPTSATCGESFSVNTDLNYQYEDDLQTLNWVNESQFVYGVPQLNQSPIEQNSLIPDAQVSNSGGVNYGFKSFNFIINDDSAVIDGDLGVVVSFEHSELSDLQVVLVSPTGTRVTLLANETYSQTHRELTWVSSHDEVIEPFNGETMQGTWRLEVTDYTPDDTGTLQEWTIGRVESYSCTQSKDNNTNNNDSGTGGGAISLLSLCLAGLLFWRRERNAKHNH
ncbi:proprotein convertase P-domain-containing protein [Vibrio sp. SCSIO 43135]|uniref:proprotein convertase P-domain-containing protein n=1 Tax=Vibrio sp. SCSIO 43135 TaxID=2819096 RepID=UPI002074B0D8|nr:proprotein convertase P-domain-containing protein [Vibrio sp. SCSIO 43135]USD42880.1 proprotein convertase P-domain-containing protein [Vibrio sp. SCSIO 43135]